MHSMLVEADVVKNSRIPDSPREPNVRLSATSRPEQVSTWSWSMVTVHEATNGLPATIRSTVFHRDDAAASTVRWGWSCMQSRAVGLLDLLHSIGGFAGLR